MHANHAVGPDQADPKHTRVPGGVAIPPPSDRGRCRRETVPIIAATNASTVPATVRTLPPIARRTASPQLEPPRGNVLFLGFVVRPDNGDAVSRHTTLCSAVRLFGNRNGAEEFEDGDERRLRAERGVRSRRVETANVALIRDSDRESVDSADRTVHGKVSIELAGSRKRQSEVRPRQDSAQLVGYRRAQSDF